MKKHYVTRWVYEATAFTEAACGQYVTTMNRLFPKRKAATYHKNHVTCKNCRRTKVFRGVR